jgi:hypothetical protein
MALIDEHKQRPWSGFSDDELLELIVNLRSRSESVDPKEAERLLGSACGEAISRGVVWPT